MEPKCFCCDKEMEPAIRDESPWEAPNGGVLLDGGGSFGSAIYDTLVDGISIRIIICDDCLKSHKHKIKEIKRT